MSRPRPRYSWPAGAKARLRPARDHAAALTGPGAAAPGRRGGCVLPSSGRTAGARPVAPHQMPSGEKSVALPACHLLILRPVRILMV